MKNLANLLKDCIGRKFYSTIHGSVTLVKVNNNAIYYSMAEEYGSYIVTIQTDGCMHPGGECILFPSKGQRDWEIWKSQNVKKTWDSLITLGNTKYKQCIISTSSNTDMSSLCKSKEEKSALAFLKIYQLIDTFYNGAMTKTELLTYSIVKYNIDYSIEDNDFYVNSYRKVSNPITFKSWSLATEFMSYPENIELLKDYYMIND